MLHVAKLEVSFLIHIARGGISASITLPAYRKVAVVKTWHSPATL